MAALGEASHRKVPGYCCTKHQHQVQQRRESNRSRNRICFSAELLAAFSWATENIDGTASLEVLLDLAIRIIRRCGWTSMQREDLMSCLYDSALMTTKDIEEAESWLIGTNSQWEERAIFAQRRYHKEKCAAAIVRCLDEVNPEFFDSYSMA